MRQRVAGLQALLENEGASIDPKIVDALQGLP
jgi:hypothetical protein